MEEQWREAQKRMESRKLEHRRRLNTPALYAIEVYCQVFTLDGVSPDSFEDEDIRIRFKFLDYACVEIEKATEEPPSGATSTTGTSSPGWSSTPTSPASPGTPGGAGTPVYDAEPTLSATPGDSGKVDGLTPSMRSHLQGLKVGSDKTPATSQQQTPSSAGTSQQQTSASAAAPQQQDGSAAENETPKATPSTPAESTAPPSESTAPLSASGTSSPTQSSPSPSTKKRQHQKDPRYFDPKKLVKQNQSPPPAGPQSASEEAGNDQPTGAETQPEEVTGEGTELKKSSRSGSRTGDGPKSQNIKRPSNKPEAEGSQTPGPDNSAITDVPDDPTISPTDRGLTEYEEDFGEDLSCTMDDRSNALFFENGKSLIFCTIPLNLLYSLPRYPLIVIFFRPPSEVLGIVRVDLSAFAEGVDSSVVLTKSIPLSAERNGTFDIVSKGRTVGSADLFIRLSCFGPFLMHKIFLRDNPNEKQTPEARTRRTASNRLIVVQMSVANLGLMRHKSKLFVSKSNPSLVGRVTRDISNLPPIVCADEHLISAPPRPKPELTIVEEEEMEKERKRLENLSKFPQYECIDDWEVVFNRQVIKDLIAKNRRPFQPGSPDRIYVESYFPELLPNSLQLLKSKGESESGKGKKTKRKRKVGKESSGDGPSLTYLELDEAWLKDNNLQRIRRKSVRPVVRTSVEDEEAPRSAPSGLSSASKFPVHTMTSMSHVAVNHFDMDKNDYSADSRVYPQNRKSRSQSPYAERSSPQMAYRVDMKNASNVAVFHFDPNKKIPEKQQKTSLDVSSSRQLRPGMVFNTRHPRVDSTLEKFNPIPSHPYAIEIRAPERSPADRLVLSLRQIGDEVDAIGGDTKMLHNIYQENVSAEGSERYIPDHLKRGQRTTQTPDEASRVLSSTAEPVLIEVDRGVPLAVPARGTPYWEGHAPACSEPANCPHFIFLHPGFGYYGR